LKLRSAIALALVCAGCGNTTPVSVQPVLASVAVGARPATPVVGEGAVWVPDTGDGTISKIDTLTNRVVKTIRIGDAQAFYKKRCEPYGSVHSFMGPTFTVRRCDLPSAVAVGNGLVWATKNDTRAIVALDPKDGHPVGTIPIDATPFELSATDGMVWVTSYQDETIERIDPRTRAVVATITQLGQGPAGLSIGPQAVWVTNSRAGTVLRIDPATNRVAATITIPCPAPCTYGAVPLAIVAGPDSVWVRNEGIATLTRIDPRTNAVVSTVDIAPFYGRDGVDAIAITPSGIWLTGLSLQRIDPVTGKPAGTIQQTGVTLAYGGGSLWVTNILGRVLRIDPERAVAG
jgi:YVTN family beta-propeller protein